MSESPRHNWPAIAGVHAASAAILVLTAAALEHRTGAIWGALEVVVFALVILFVLGRLATRKHSALRKRMRKAAGHHVVRTAVLAWAGIGPALDGLSGLVALIERPHEASLSLTSALVSGPFSAPAAAHASGSVELFALATILWFGTSAFLIVDHRRRFHGDTKTLLAKATKLGGKDRAPDEEPSGAHFASVAKGLEQIVVPKDVLDNRLLLGTAELAPAWGQRLRTVQVALAQEGSAILFGGPGSGKSTIFQTILLNSRRTGPAETLLPTRFVVLSTKPRDLAGPTTDWLRQQGPVEIWDLTGKTVSSSRWGDPIRWSPLESVSDWDTAKRLAKKLVEAGRDADSRERDSFWLQQAMSLIAPALLAARLDGAEYAAALSWAQQWTTADFTTVDRVLEARGETEALHTWKETRKMLLTERSDGSGWEENHGAGGAAATGLSINATLSGLLLSLSSASARSATHDPNFDPETWVRSDGAAALFLVGDWQAPETTRSLLVPLVNELLDSAYAFATEQDTERLPYRLVMLGDELANLAPIEGLDRYFSTARSHGIQLLAAFQSYGQLEAAYGRQAARTVVDATAATVVLSGIRDRDLIAMVCQAGGSEHVEVESETKTREATSKTTSKQARALLEGHHITQMRGPAPDRPGDGLLLIPGAVVKLRIPLWARTEPYCRRGTPHPDHAESHAEHLAKLDRKFVGRARRVWATVAAKWVHDAESLPSAPATAAIEAGAEAPSVRASDPTPAQGLRCHPVSEQAVWPPETPPDAVNARLDGFRASRTELQEAIGSGTVSEDEAAQILDSMVAVHEDLEWALDWSSGEARWRVTGDKKWHQLAA